MPRQSRKLAKTAPIDATPALDACRVPSVAPSWVDVYLSEDPDLFDYDPAEREAAEKKAAEAAKAAKAEATALQKAQEKAARKEAKKAARAARAAAKAAGKAENKLTRGRPRRVNPETGLPMTRNERQKLRRQQAKENKDGGSKKRSADGEPLRPPSRRVFIGPDVKESPPEGIVSHHGKGKSKISPSLLALRRDRIKASYNVDRHLQTLYTTHFPRTGMTALTVTLGETGTLKIYTDETMGETIDTIPGREFFTLLTAFVTNSHRHRAFNLKLTDAVDGGEDSSMVDANSAVDDIDFDSD